MRYVYASLINIPAKRNILNRRDRRLLSVPLKSVLDVDQIVRSVIKLMKWMNATQTHGRDKVPTLQRRHLPH